MAGPRLGPGAERVATHIVIEQPFDLASTLESGQAFRWRREGQWYRGVIFDNLVLLRRHLLGVEFRCHPESEETLAPRLRDYLRLDDELAAIYDAINRDPVMADVLERYRGMRLLRQEPWECLVAFICSANSNIPRISATMENMAQRLGGRLTYRGRDFFTFPTPEVLVAVGEAGLRALGLGFRAKYVAQAAAMVASGELALEPLRSVPYQQAKVALLNVPGVGDKVADCVLLFSLDKLEAFPIDRWVRRALEDAYFGGKTLSYQDICVWAMEYYGPYAGYAQQYLFHGKRLGKG